MKSNIKKLIKRNKIIYKFVSDSRETLRIIYNTKRRSRFFWMLRNGDDTLSLNYPLNDRSIIFDIGAYTGIFTEKIFNKFECEVHAFEPLKEYSDILVKKFKRHPKVIINNFGLLDEDQKLMVSNIGAGSSIFSRPEGQPDNIVTIKSFIKYVNENSIEKINYMYINIEGSEYKLLDHIINTGYINNIDHIQIQFHNFVDNSKILRNKIRQELRRTHECKFNFPFIWERWDRVNKDDI
tara:strand:- start:22257 stop:22970 length:714 start_codon:yes stop_codon:yes gene_type:complete